ncbi:MAG: cell division protein SepF [Christensenellales bacterium]
MAGKFLSKIMGAIGLEEVNEDESELDNFIEEENTADDHYDDVQEPQEQVETQHFNRGRKGKVVNMMPTANQNASIKMVVFQPMSYDDTQSIIDNLKTRKPVIINLESLEIDIAQRVLDFVSGAVYALAGSIHKVSKGIFVLAPSNVNITGNVGEETKHRTAYGAAAGRYR